ncbi:MAG: hypothetical protein PXX73_10265 [Sideroxydans sp.]|nr:hypothetical protein [Sideroxydans sp.]
MEDAEVTPVNMLTYTDFIERVKLIQSDDHYLKKVSPIYDDYLRGLHQSLNRLCQAIGTEKSIKFLSEKLQFSTVKFDEAQYIQSACELSVMSHFSRDADFNFEYEKKVCPPKNVDFSITQNSVRYNVEIKCASYVGKVDANINQIVISFQNRVPNPNSKDSICKELKDRLSKNDSPEVVEQKNMDNNLKDFLVSMQNKVGCAPKNDVNVLVACCDDEIDMQTWRGYLWGAGGFFTKKPTVLQHDKFNNVDYILLTNLFNRHKHFHTDTAIKNHWELSSSFCLLYPNHFSSRNKCVENGLDDVKQLSTIFPNLSVAFEEYFQDKCDLPTDENFEMKKLVMGVAWFVDKQAQQYFAKRA